MTDDYKRTSKSRLIVVVGMILGLFVVYYQLFLWQMGAPLKGSYWVSETRTVKRYIASTAQKPALFVMGGSNALFGLDSKTLGEQLNLNVVNMAIHGAMPFSSYVDDAITYTDSGDIVLFLLEFNTYSAKHKYSNWYLRESQLWDAENLLKKPFAELLGVMFSVPSLHIIDGAIGKLNKEKMPEARQRFQNEAKIVEDQKQIWAAEQKAESYEYGTTKNLNKNGDATQAIGNKPIKWGGMGSGFLWRLVYISA